MSHIPTWRQASQVFDQRAEEYDSWFEDSMLFDIELAALKEIHAPILGPKLEIGVGSGRFARAMNVTFGVDPAITPLLISQKRGIRVIQSTGEELPVAGNVMGTVFLLFALCFISDPMLVFIECSRVLKEGGHLVIGMIPSTGPWGQALQEKKKKGHPFYEYARFYDPAEVDMMLEDAGFCLVEKRSSLFQLPDNVQEFEHSIPGSLREAGFQIIVARK